MKLQKPRRCSLEGVLVATCLSYFAPPAATAHHSSALYDLERDVMLDGVVTKYEWANPHVYVFVRSQSGGAASAVWEVEASPPAIMARRG